MKKRLGRISPALVISVIALFVALGSGAYAVKVKLGKNVVKTKSIKNGAVTEPKIAKGAVSSDKLGNGAVTADKLGGNGLGRAIAFAQVNADGTVGANSRGISTSNVTREGTSNNVYCFHGLPQFGTATVTPGWGATEFDGIVSANMEQAPFREGLCSDVSGAQVGVLTYFDDFFGTIAPARSPMPFFITLFQ
jgi:hypothetical protein